jgi:hypothetical protein
VTQPKNLLEKGHAAGVEAHVTDHQRERGVGTTTETGKGMEIERERGEYHVRRVGVGREMTAEIGTEIEIGGEGNCNIGSSVTKSPSKEKFMGLFTGI